MNELSVIGSLRLRKNFWIATGQTLQAAVRRPKKTDFGEGSMLFRRGFTINV